jgi:hypothetical protein
MRTPAEILREHNIDYVETRKGTYTTTCPNCNRGYLNVKIDRKGTCWYCHDCKWSGPQPSEKEDKGGGDLGPIKDVFDYTNETGERLFQVLKFEPLNAPKEFRQRTNPDQKKWSIKGVRIVPYRLPELIDDLAAERVIFIVEGEKDVNTLRDQGVPATCNPMGAGKWWPEFNEILRGADIVICGDNDQPGRDHVALVANNLHAAGCRLRVLDLASVWPDIEESDDISDWFKAGGTVERLWEFVEKLPEWKPKGGNGEAPQPWEAAEVVPDEAGEVFGVVPKDDGPALPPILSQAEFLKGFVPPDYIVDGMLQRRFIYALTGQTGHAKTAIALLLARLIGSADPNARLGTHRVEKGRVVYFVGENPDDIRMRIIGANALRDDDASKDRIFFIPGVFNISEMHTALVATGGEVDFVIVDTSAAYFLGNDEISNPQMGAHARMLRSLTTLPGGPCVFVLCHPIKYVTEPNQLLPRGGGAFLAEMDGNLTAWKHDEALVELHHNKIRGPGFEPMTFRIEKFTTPALVDSKGRMISTVQAVPITEIEEETQTRQVRDDEDHVLAALLKDPDGSVAEMARACCWILQTGEPHKSKVHRILERLEKSKLVKRKRGGWVLSDEGKDAARKAALRFAERHP